MKKEPATPPGFRRLYSNGRLVFQAIDKNVLLEHDSLIHYLLARTGDQKFSMPDQFDCIQPHLGKRFLFKLDLADAYGTIEEFGLELVLGLDEDFHTARKYYLHSSGGLIQGAPASAILFYLYVQEFVERDLTELCIELELVWTRYVDDFLFSSNKFIPPITQKKIISLLKESGFRINKRKTRAVDLHNEEYLEYLGMFLYRNKVEAANKTMLKLERYPFRSPQRKNTQTWINRVLALNKYWH